MGLWSIDLNASSLFEYWLEGEICGMLGFFGKLKFEKFEVKMIGIKIWKMKEMEKLRISLL